ncbi:MAG: zinc-binding dehydrogenase [Candidatus Wallbacteria bacterium]|nr:zinc-binding dehydrogenase [Candidatus Wallbacteria bacterium]
MPAAQAIVVSRHGGPEVLVLREVEVAAPEPHQVQIAAKAVGLNFADVYERLGLYEAAPPPPFVPGFELAGVVTAVGRDVTRFRPGDRVAGATRFGGYATLVNVSEWFCFAMPAAATFEEAAGFPCVYATAFHALYNLGQLRDGMKVLIHAAAGGVGIAALQLARQKDVEIFATAGSDEKLKVARAHGAHHAINYEKEDFEPIVRAATKGRGVDLVLDSVLGEVFRKSYRLLAPTGQLVAFGAATMMPAGPRPNWLKLAWQWLRRPRVDPLQMIGENRAVSGFNLVYLFDDRRLADVCFGPLARLWHEGALKPLIGLTLPFERAGEAQEALRGRRTVGKVVLTVGTPAATSFSHDR